MRRSFMLRQSFDEEIPEYSNDDMYHAEGNSFGDLDGNSYHTQYENSFNHDFQDEDDLDQDQDSEASSQLDQEKDHIDQTRI